MIPFLAVAACFAMGLVHLLHLAAPPRTDLVASVGRWDLDRARASRQVQVGDPRATSPLSKLAKRIAEELSRRGRDWTSFNQDLAITGATLEAHVAKTLGLAAVALVGPSAIFGLLAMADVAVPLSMAAVFGLALAVGIVFLAHREIRSEATSRRAEFRRSLSIYLDLVAMSLEAGRGHAEALPASARIGTGWTFVELQDAIEGARYSGASAWRALGQLGHRIGVPELVDLEGALTLANDDGAKVRASLIARAATLRAARVADVEAEANQATESIKFALIAMVFAFLTYELYPSIARLYAG